MEDKDLKHLSKKELIDIIYEMKLQEEKLQRELADTKASLADRDIRMENVGSIAEAALSINDIFSVAQNAADEYLHAIKMAQSDSEQSVQRAKKESEQIVEKAQIEAEIRLKKANEECSARLEETDKVVNARWEEFQQNVEKVLSAHAELSGLLQRPGMTQS